MLDFICGVGPASERVGTWLDAHPGACFLLLWVLPIALCGLLEGSL